MINKLVFGFLIGAGAPHVVAQAVTDIQAPPSNAYSQNSDGTVTRNPYGLCWRSGSWTPDDAIPGCDGALTPPIPNPIAPEVINNQEAPVDNVTLAKPCNLSFTLEGDQTFAFNKAILNHAAKQHIDQQILPRLAECKGDITITGHTDVLGPSKFNQTLSEKRATAVANYFSAKGVQTNIQTLGAGASQPIKSCSKKMKSAQRIACLSANRRVSIDVAGSKTSMRK